MTSIYERVYINRDNYTEVTFSEHGGSRKPLDLSNVTRMVLTLTSWSDGVSEITVDTDNDADSITWTGIAKGAVQFSLGDVGGEENESYVAALVAYDAVHTDGQVLLDGEYPIQLVFCFFDV